LEDVFYTSARGEPIGLGVRNLATKQMRDIVLKPELRKNWETGKATLWGILIPYSKVDVTVNWATRSADFRLSGTTLRLSQDRDRRVTLVVRDNKAKIPLEAGSTLTILPGDRYEVTPPDRK
jgi:hypothetical protein